MPIETPKWEDTTEEKVPTWEETGPDISPDLARNIQFAKERSTVRDIGGDLEPTTDFETAVAQNPVGFLKSIPGDIAQTAETAAAGIGNLPARAYRALPPDVRPWAKPALATITGRKYAEQAEPGQVFGGGEKPLPLQPGEPIVKPRGTVLQPEGNPLEKLVTGFFTPGNIASFPFAAAKPVQAYFMAQTAPGAITAAKKLVDPSTPLSQRGDAATDLLVNGLMTYGLAHGLIKNPDYQPSNHQPSTEEQNAPNPVSPEPSVPPQSRAETQTETAGRPSPGPREETPTAPGEVSLTPQRAAGVPPAPQTLNPGPQTPDPNTRTQLTPERQTELATIGKETGFAFDGVAEYPGVKPLIGFTFKNLPKDDPAYGASFYIHANATPAEILAKANAKATEFREGAAPPAPTAPIKSTEPTVPTTGETPSREEIGIRPVSETSRAPIDLSPQAAQSRLAWRKFNPIGPGEGGTRWGAIENTYISAKAAQEALPGVPLKDIFGITIKRGPYPNSPEVDHFFVNRLKLNEFTSDPVLNKKYPPGEFSQSVAPGYKPHSPRKGEPSYKEWLAGKRPASAPTEPGTPASGPAPEPPTHEEPGNRLKFLSVPETDPGDLKKTINDLHTTRETLRSQQAEAGARMKELEKVVTYQTGPRYQRGHVKPSAPKKALAEYNNIRAKWSQLGSAANAIEEQIRNTGKPVEIFKLQQRVNNATLPALTRLMARKELFFAEGKTPPDALGRAIRAESDRIVRERYPDATETELRNLEHAVSREGSAGGNFDHAWQLDPELNLNAARRTEIKQAIADTSRDHVVNDFSETLKDEIEQYAPLYAKEPKTSELSRAKTDELIARIKKEAGAIVAQRQAESAAAATAAAEMEKKFTTVIETDAVNSGKQAKEQLVGALENALEKAPEEAAGRATVSIHIPGDGHFKMFNTKEQIAYVLDEARKLDTSKGGKFQKIPVTHAKLSAGADARRAIEVYGTRARAYHTLKKQVGMAKELELTPEQTSGLAKVVEVLENTISEKWNKARETLSRAEDREEFLVKQFGEKSKQVTENRKNIEAFKRGEAQERAEMEKELGQGESTPSAKSTVKESRIASAPFRRADPFTMDEGDLADLLESQHGVGTGRGVAGQFGRTGEFTFPNFDAFAKWMDERYAERDHEGMRLAFAEADTQSKIRYIKENRAADPHKKAWLTNLATGAELPKTDGPRPRTTPRPSPGGSGRTPRPPAAPKPREGGPPQPPRAPTHHRKFDITALTQFFRLFSKHPTMNMRIRKAYGHFVEGPNIVELKNRLFWDTKLAERVLGHEIGHFIDLAVRVAGKGKQLAERLKPMFDFKNDIAQKKDLRNQARDLSRDWRGSFQNGDRYRDSAEELFADFMSAMFNNPEWVNQTYPKLFDAFQHLRDGKPQFKSAYREIETWLQGDTMVRELADQDKAAVEKTLDILTQEKEKSKASALDRAGFAMLTLWNRAFEKEGQPRLIGTSIREKLEGSYMWAAKKLALWHDDFMQTVQPELDKVSADPVEARAHLLSYSKAVRTIGERRAAGLWIEKNPDEARTLLTKLLRLDPTLYSKFGGDLQKAANADLYDLSAQIFREIHDRGTKYVTRISRAIDKMNLGVEGDAALMAFNVRGKLLNPGGLTVENSVKMLDHLREQLAPDKFAALEKAAAGLRDLMHQVQAEMYQSGLISKKTWTELIEPNKDNYLPYAVLDYFDGRVRAGVMPQRGTALDVADVAASTELKVSSAYLWLQKQRQVQLMNEAYARGGSPLVPGEALERASDLDKIQKQNAHDDTSRAVIWVDGTPYLMEFPGDPGKMLQKAMELPDFYNHIEWLHTASKFSHQVMQLYTQLSPRFLLYRNIIRGFRTAGLKVGFIGAAKQMSRQNFQRNLALARNYADAAFGGEMLPAVRALVDAEALPPPRLALGAVRDLPNMRELLAQGSLPAFAAQRIRADVAAHRGNLLDKAQQAKNTTDKIFTAYEAFEKIYNYQAAIAKGLAPETAAAIAKRGGIPNPGVSGKWSSAAEVFFPWTRVRMQGMRSSYDLVRDPRFRKGFLARFMLTEAAPRIAKVALGVGLVSKAISWMTGNNQNKDDDVMAEVFKRISPYKMALDDVVPMAFYDPRTGKYHPFSEFKKGSDIPKHFEVVSLRIPASEEGQTWGTMLYNAMVSVPGAQEKLARPGEGVVENMGNWAYNYLLPQANPFIQTTEQLGQMIFRGRNPEDSFRGQPAANEQLFKAGGSERAQAITGYAFNQGGGLGELAGLIAVNAGMDPRALDSVKGGLATDQRTWDQKIPFLGAAVSHDNYAEFRTEEAAKMEEEKLRARSRLIMPDDVRSLYDFYYQNQERARAGKLTPAEKTQYEASKHFVNQIWGDLTKAGKPNPDSFFSKSAHAVGPDGSAQAKATLKRDLEHAAAMDIAQFHHARGH